MTTTPPSSSRPPDDDQTTLRPTAAAGAGGSGRNRPVRLLVVLAAAVLAVILGVVGGAVVVGGRDRVDPGTTPTPTLSPTPQGHDPASTVRGFLEALARNDAAAALGYAETLPADTSFMTNEVLTVANAANPITEINVPPVPSSTGDSERVQASYKIGDERVTDTFDLDLVGTDWKLSELGSELDVASDRSAKVPMIIAGRTVDSDTVILLPGAYPVTSGLTFLDWGPETTILVKSPGSFLSASPIELRVNEAGTAAFLTATKTSLEACVKIKKVKPSGCPFGYDNSSYTITPSTITWALAEDPLAGKTPKVSYDDDSLATMAVTVKLQLKAKGVQNYDKSKITVNTTVNAYATASATMTGDTVKITWSS